MTIQSQFEREEDRLAADFEAGRITNEQYSRELRELRRDFRDAMREREERAFYDQETGW